MNIFDIIIEEHKNFRKVANKLEEMTSRAIKTRTELFTSLKKELESHHEAEEKSLFSELYKHKETKELSLECIEEHNVIKYLIGELESLNVDHESWGPKFKVFKEMLEHHLDEEEKEVFIEARKILDKDTCEELGEKFKKVEEAIENSN
ncbi:hemerythrin domain-containing protein [Clostridium sp. CS001]|uniref:hemerythrin domain-containing protein n=1 Tax=Clostridium sp. CS001 TaxID=2880648 RepID=UPI001CF23DBC|nr:hemerythrin domain-containing protein [Clostridium sp. CS001]MCB2288484.1 hemerythrin domain-containing protein [Clostridium sp. CS001]